MAERTEGELLDEIVRLNALRLRREASSQNEMILEMNRVGFGPTRIAELLGTTAGTVNKTVSNAKKARVKK